ncbi:helix-turn-helix transcriptional regulator [Burkholderia plantarii]|uniref:helix-turn-helix transcriptional regulator n=1 Tax=Burkholderia plantarii TaxID=41899 RepID=UPI0018DC21CF|nr:AraC family transcriptional regulator [Burkholderia plantarii]MBI0330280.1 helix-turn-helix transcriptional regulator [Burkholderia plantarii]
MQTVADADTASAAVPPVPRDTLGCLSSKLRKNLQFQSGDFTFHRKCMDAPQLERVALPASDRGFLVGISLRAGHHRRIFRGTRAEDCRFDRHSIYIRDFSENYVADLYGNFDFLLLELSSRFLVRLGDEHDAPAIDGLLCAAEQADPVLGHLGAAIAAGIETPGELGARFVEQVGLAIGLHLAQRYGSLAPREARLKGRLSAMHEARAKELLLLRDHHGSSLADIARECNLSRSYFIRAFARTTGRTPHQWLLEQRTAQARGMIESTRLSLADIAIACGFSDQSHLSRVFTKMLGVTPGAWRRGGGN